MAVKFFEKLSNNYFELLDDKEDFNIICNELAKISKDKNNIKILDFKNITSQQFGVIVKNIYRGIVLLENNDSSFIFELIVYKFLFKELAKYPETHLIESKAHWLTTIYQKSCQNKNLKNYKNDAMIL
ncbi:hypothetical protein C2G38_2185970 [Gigaspora rosea]|uniref:BTB domain-containing protein n=1 Tax=Gigaspora rosea TaxID=44941 RepID=A0A397V8F8_9GLOM|nr:hypothetical protein C2G38_2185970 [Gigaspora rosea]